MDLGALPFPGLTKTRERLLDVLSRLTFPRALKYLDVGPGLEEEARRNLTLRDAPAAPAHEVYTGVLYEHLGLGSLPRRERADRRARCGASCGRATASRPTGSRWARRSRASPRCRRCGATRCARRCPTRA